MALNFCQSKNFEKFKAMNLFERVEYYSLIIDKFVR